MVSISIDSGEFRFDESSGGLEKNKNALKVLVVGDFSGRKSLGLMEAKTIASRKQPRVDKDNFDDVFLSLNVKLQLSICDDPICFTEMDDLHPDHLFENISLFDRYKSLARKIKSPSQFHDTVQALVDDGLVTNLISNSSTDESEKPDSGNLLDSLLSSTTPQNSTTDIQALIRETVAPYVQAKENPQVAEYSVAIESAMNDVMRQIMHASAFQQLEASWRGVDLLNRRLDTDRACHLHLLDISTSEILSDLNNYKGDLQGSQLFKSIVEQHSTAGSQHYDVIIVDNIISGLGDDIKLLEGLSEIASFNGATVLSGSSYGQVESFITSEKDVSTSWLNFCAQERSKNTYLASPSFMLRLPYGRKTANIDAFKYEELPIAGAHPYYLWGNSAYLMLIILAEAVQNEGAKSVNLSNRTVERLPIHIFTEEGETSVKPCAETYITDGDVTKLEGLGLTAVQSVKGSDHILISRWQSAASC